MSQALSLRGGHYYLLVEYICSLLDRSSPSIVLGLVACTFARSAFFRDEFPNFVSPGRTAPWFDSKHSRETLIINTG